MELFLERARNMTTTSSDYLSQKQKLEIFPWKKLRRVGLRVCKMVASACMKNLELLYLVEFLSARSRKY